jgi:bacteriochlorophyll 4-vinyl reductase
MYLVALEDVVGKHGVATVLRFAKLKRLIGSYPPDNLEPEVSFEDFAAINQAIEDIYGEHGAKGICLRAGEVVFGWFRAQGDLVPGYAEVSLRLLPVGTRLKAGLATVAEGFTRLGDQVTSLREGDDSLLFVIEQCPVCWGRTSQTAICYAVTGMLQEALQWLAGGQSLAVVETRCKAKGADACTFTIDKRPKP